MKNFLNFVFSISVALCAIAGALTVFYKLLKKHLKFTVEVLPDNIQDENELTAAVDAVDIDIPEEENEEIEISFTEEN